MIVTALSCPSDDDPSGSVMRGVAGRLSIGLAGRPPDSILGPVGRDAAQLRRTDLLVVALAVPPGAPHAGLLDLLATERVLAGCVVFLAAIGPWPAEVGTADRALLPALRRAGGICAAPTLHVVDGTPAPIELYCRYWAPVVGTLLAGGTRPAVAA